MSELNLPYYPLKTKVVGNRIYVFDDWRSKYVPLTPEEEVRQRFLHYLVGKSLFCRSFFAVFWKYAFVSLLFL